MKVEQLSTSSGQLMGVPLLISLRVFDYDRGIFYESWNQRRLDEAVGMVTTFVQDNYSRSSRGELHYQLESEPQMKLVRCSTGAIRDVAVDLLRRSVTFGQWVCAALSAENQRLLWVPMGFCHGFLSIREYAEILYKTSVYRSKACERSIRWNDPGLGVTWPLEQIGWGEPLLAEKDSADPSPAEAVAAGEVFG